jgi:dehydrogenase/reductase SDR family protein 12
MGNHTSYAKFATLFWYREGCHSYGTKGYETACKTFSDLTQLHGAGGGRLLDGRVVLITGANQGIGYEAALQCAKLGGEVHLLCRDGEKGSKAADTIRAEVGGASVRSHILDVNDFDAVRDFATKYVPAHVVTNDKRIDVLVNNAGCMPTERQETKQGHEAIVATALGGAVLLTHLLLPHMSDSARVINVASGGQYTVGPRIGDLNLPSLTGKCYDGTLVYAYAKRWTTELTQTMAESVSRTRPGISFYSMHPGWADTAGVKHAMPSFREKRQKSGDALRTPAQGADTITFLAAAPVELLAEGVSSEQRGPPPGNGAFWFDRKVVPRDMPYSGTHWTQAQRAELADAAARYCGLVTLTPS